MRRTKTRLYLDNLSLNVEIKLNTKSNDETPKT